MNPRRWRGSGLWHATCTVLIVVLPAVNLVNAADLDEAACCDLGFNGLQVCSNCDTMEQYVGDKELVEDCRKCCTAGSSDSMASKFHIAIIEVCKHRLREFPTVEHFINEKADDFENLDIVYRFGSSPRLILKGDKGQKEMLRIDRWKTEAIEEFLRDKLISIADT